MSPFSSKAAYILIFTLITCTPAVFSCKPSAPKQKTTKKTTTPPPTTNDFSHPLLKSRSASLPLKPQRIITLAPNLTEILFALGKEKRLVGVTRFCDYPPAAKKITPIGGFVDPNIEVLLAQKPDLVLGMISGSDKKLAQKLDKFKIPYAFWQMDSLEQVQDGILGIAMMLGDKKAGEAVILQMNKDIKSLADAPKEKPKTLIVLGHKPLVVAGQGTFLDALLKRAGGENAAGHIKGKYPVLDMEIVLKLSPEVIIDTTMVVGKTKGREDHLAELPNITSDQKQRGLSTLR